jgi:acyl carrier protein
VTFRDTILSTMQHVAGELNCPLAPLTDDLLLLDSGLDSLGLAVLVANLEDKLGVDPFGTGGFPMVVTVGDLVKVYDECRSA